MAEVLEAVCQKRKLPDPKDYALVVDIGGVKILIPLDRTVKSLQGKRDLMLIKKNMLQQYGVEVNKREGRTTDPNASIFKRNSEVPGTEQIYSSVFDYTSAYKVSRPRNPLVLRSRQSRPAIHYLSQGAYVGHPKRTSAGHRWGLHPCT